MSTNNLIEILMAEDSPDDRMLAEAAIKSSKLANRLHTVENGEEVMAFLRKQPPFENAPEPDLILLDVNMPRKTGLEALMEIKNDPALKHLPVVILTSSKADRDIFKAYEQHANCYIVKPVDFERFMEVVRSIENFWFGIVKLPPKHK